MIDRAERLAELHRLMPTGEDMTALDLGCGQHFPLIYGPCKFRSVLGINTWELLVLELAREYAERPEWRFERADARSFVPPEIYDVITALHFVEHLQLPELRRMLDRLMGFCRHTFLVETPEQFDDNLTRVQETGNPWEEHKSLVTAEVLAEWNFQLLFRYQMNEQFSNAVYLWSGMRD